MGNNGGKQHQQADGVDMASPRKSRSNTSGDPGSPRGPNRRFTSRASVAADPREIEILRVLDLPQTFGYVSERITTTNGVDTTMPRAGLTAFPNPRRRTVCFAAITFPKSGEGALVPRLYLEELQIDNLLEIVNLSSQNAALGTAVGFKAFQEPVQEGEENVNVGNGSENEDAAQSPHSPGRGYVVTGIDETESFVGSDSTTATSDKPPTLFELAHDWLMCIALKSWKISENNNEESITITFAIGPESTEDVADGTYLSPAIRSVVLRMRWSETDNVWDHFFTLFMFPLVNVFNEQRPPSCEHIAMMHEQHSLFLAVDERLTQLEDQTGADNDDNLLGTLAHRTSMYRQRRATMDSLQGTPSNNNLSRRSSFADEGGVAFSFQRRRSRAASMRSIAELRLPTENDNNSSAVPSPNTATTTTTTNSPTTAHRLRRGSLSAQRRTVEVIDPNTKEVAMRRLSSYGSSASSSRPRRTLSALKKTSPIRTAAPSSAFTGVESNASSSVSQDSQPVGASLGYETRIKIDALLAFRATAAKEAVDDDDCIPVAETGDVQLVQQGGDDEDGDDFNFDDEDDNDNNKNNKNIISDDKTHSHSAIHHEWDE
eukprot:PhM_4_TR7878/c0_g1_i1/m.12138